MSLVPCPECGGQVSPAAVSCPHCGFPLQGGATGSIGAGASVPAPFAPGGPMPLAETEAWQGAPSLRAMAVEGMTTAITALVVVVAVVMIYDPVLSFVAGLSRDARVFVSDNEGRLRVAAMAIVAVAVGTRLLRLGWRALGLRSHRYRLSNQRLIVESGVLTKSIDEIDMRTVEDVTLHQTVTQRLLGVGEIAIVSSDPGGGRARTRTRLLGVPNPRTVRELVRDTAYRASRGQVFTRST